MTLGGERATFAEVVNVAFTAVALEVIEAWLDMTTVPPRVGVDDTADVVTITVPVIVELGLASVEGATWLTIDIGWGADAAVVDVAATDSSARLTLPSTWMLSPL